MKKIVLFFVIAFCCNANAQYRLKITPKKCVPKKGIHFKLQEIVEDSRCPEGVTCIWAGQVVVEVAVYENRKFIETKTLTFNGKYNTEIKNWFATYLPNDKKISTIKVLPAPKDGVAIPFKKRYIELVFQ